MKPHVLYAMLQQSKITVERVAIALSDQFYGPQLTINARLDTPGFQSPGELYLQLALNQKVQKPIALKCIFGPDVKLEWLEPEGPSTAKPFMRIIIEVTDTIVRQMAMESVSGYTEHAQRVHRSFVGFADV